MVRWGSGAGTTQACGRQVAAGAALPFEPETGEERGGGSGEGDCHVGRSMKWVPVAS
jgi:hypothetical protein